MKKVHIKPESEGHFFYIALSILLSGRPDSVIPEIMYFLTPKKIKTLTHMFGGQIVYIPTPKELSLELMCAFAIYYKDERGFTWNQIQDKLEIDGNRIRSVKRKTLEYKKYLDKEGLSLAKIFQKALVT